MRQLSTNACVGLSKMEVRSNSDANFLTPPFVTSSTLHEGTTTGSTILADATYMKHCPGGSKRRCTSDSKEIFTGCSSCDASTACVSARSTQ